MARFYATNDFVGKAATESNGRDCVWCRRVAQKTLMCAVESRFFSVILAWALPHPWLRLYSETSALATCPRAGKPGSVIDIGLLDARCRTGLAELSTTRPSGWPADGSVT